MAHLVTGSAGFIGRHYCRKYDSIGIDLKTGDDLFNYLTNKEPPETNGIVHLAAVSGILESNQMPVHSINTNVMGTVTMLDVARRTNQKIIVASSAAADNPINPYAAGKLSAEAICAAYGNTYGVKYTCLRFANVYGPDSKDKNSVVAKMIKDALTTGIITVYGDGKQRRVFIYIDDVVDVIHACMEQDTGHVYAVATGELESINTIAEFITEHIYSEIRYEKSPRVETTPEPPGIPMINTKVELYEGLSKTIEWYKNELT